MELMTYRLWLNESRTVLVRLWDNGRVELATRETADSTWGPSVHLREEHVTGGWRPAYAGDGYDQGSSKLADLREREEL